MRGWSCRSVINQDKVKICPAYAGMILQRNWSNERRTNLSRVCGDDPASPDLISKEMEFVPRMRGWSRGFSNYGRPIWICPAYAGMILQATTIPTIIVDLSRVCGDDPKRSMVAKKYFLFVPRMRGWSLCKIFSRLSTLICPAYAGMILNQSLLLSRSLHLSRVCGDDPASNKQSGRRTVFVPRMRGWSWFRIQNLLWC